MLGEKEMIDKIAEVFAENGFDAGDRESIAKMNSIQYNAILTSLEEIFHIEFPAPLRAWFLFEDMDNFYEFLVFRLAHYGRVLRGGEPETIYIYQLEMNPKHDSKSL